MAGDVVDLFGGPGGMDLGARAVGLDPLGIEWDEAACLTREAAGLRTLQADVAELNPLDFDCDRLIASPPCQAYSQAGKRQGQADQRHVLACASELAAGKDTRELHAASCSDPRSILVVEPLRWALALRPEWIVLEQVPPVLDLWLHFREILRFNGYSAWAGILSSERFGVPQTRRRAFLIADRRRPVVPPHPTHQEFVFGEPAAEQHTMEGTLLPWVSMADALGWGMTARPSVTVAATSTNGGGPRPLDGGAHSRQIVADAQESGAWRVGFPRRSDGREGDGEYRERDFRDADEPAFPITEKARSWVREEVVMRGNAQDKATVRALDEPAPTIKGGHDSGERLWVNTGRDWKEGGSRDDAQKFDAEERPAPAFTAKSRWTADRPATTIAGDSRVHPPGHKENGDDPPGKFEQRRGANAIRVSIEEAAVLQGFPADYPWQGNRTKRFEQIGNAVPPPFAAAVLATVA